MAAPRTRTVNHNDCRILAVHLCETHCDTGRNALNLNTQQRKTVLAAFLGWTLDAFDFFLLTFLLSDIASEFQTDVPGV
jgi:hypothetical protein